MFGRKKKLLAAARANDAAAVEKYYKAGYCLEAGIEAIRHNAEDALKVLLKRNPYLAFASGRMPSRICTRRWIAVLHEAGAPENMFALLYTANKNATYGDVEIEDFITPDMSLSAMQQLIKLDDAAFAVCVEKVGLKDTEKLKFILTLAPKKDNGQLVINNALLRMAGNGDNEKAQLLLDRGANPDYANGEALERAAAGGHADTVALLLPHVSLADIGPDLVTKLQQKGVNKDIIVNVQDAVRTALKDAPLKPAASKAPAVQENYMRLDDHTLAETQSLPDGGTLTTLFNFATGQQQILFTDAQQNSHMPIIVSFKDMEDTLLRTLRQKFDDLAQRPTAAEDMPVPAGKPRAGNYDKLRKGL